jgi:AcrR family transcriptional regulator
VYGGVPAAERHAERRERLMAAALELLGTEGWSATTVRGVCAHAKLTPRFFYESFADLDALVLAVFDDLVAETTGTVLGAVAVAVQEDPDDRQAHARAAIGTLGRELISDPRRARILFVEALGNEALARRRLEALRMVADVIAAQGRSSYRTPPQEDGFVALTSTLLAGGLAELLIVWLDGGLDISREQLVEDCVALFVATGDSASQIVAARAGTRAG